MLAPFSIAFLNNLAGPDMLLIMVILLFLFGAKKLPELAKGLGQSVREFKKASSELHDEPKPAPASEVECVTAAAEPTKENPAPAPAGSQFVAGRN